MTVTPAEWSARLRDPNSKQTTQRLRRVDSMCCLGHLADLIDPEAWEYEHHDELWNGLFATLDGYAPDWLTVHERNTAVSLNDTYGWTLPQIADWNDAGRPTTVTRHSELAELAAEQEAADA